MRQQCPAPLPFCRDKTLDGSFERFFQRMQLVAPSQLRLVKRTLVKATANWERTVAERESERNTSMRMVYSAGLLFYLTKGVRIEWPVGVPECDVKLHLHYAAKYEASTQSA